MLTLRLDPALEAELDRQAARAGLSRSELVRRILRDRLERERRKPKPLLVFHLGGSHPPDAELYPDPRG